MASTLNQSPKAFIIPTDGKWYDVNKVEVPGSAGEPVATKIYLNISGTLKPGMFGGIIDVRMCRNSITNEADPNFDSTCNATESVLGWTKNKAGIWTFKHYISRPWWTTRNYSTTIWQVRTRAHIATATAKVGYYTGATDFE